MLVPFFLTLLLFNLFFVGNRSTRGTRVSNQKVRIKLRVHRIDCCLDFLKFEALKFQIHTCVYVQSTVA